jgi:hypothetical protein
MVKRAKECIGRKASNLEIYGSMQAVFLEMDASSPVSAQGLLVYSLLVFGNLLVCKCVSF